jgi:hypothetical protein
MGWDEEDCSDGELFKMEFMPVDGMNRGGIVAWLDAAQVAPSPGVHGHGSGMPCTPPAREAIEHTTPPSASPNLDTDDVPRRYRRLEDILGVAPQPMLADRQVIDELLAAIGGEPVSADEALKDDQWRLAMMEELESIKENKTWTLVDLPRGHCLIGVKWIFKLKRDEHGDVIKHKSRLVAKGYVQRQGVDFEEVFAPVARMESVRVMLCFASHINWTIHHMDVKSAFLNGDLAEEVYVTQPPGFINEGQEAKVMRLHKALYGRLCMVLGRLPEHGTQDLTQSYIGWASRNASRNMAFTPE